MSYKVSKAGNKYNVGYREFCITDISDLDSLPTSTPNSDCEIASAGSKAYTQDGTHVYMLGTDDVWREIPTGGGRGGYVLPPATKDRLGGVMIGSGIVIEENGTASVDLDAVAEEITDTVTENVINSASATDNEVDEVIEEVFGDD